VAIFMLGVAAVFYFWGPVAGLLALGCFLLLVLVAAQGNK